MALNRMECWLAWTHLASESLYPPTISLLDFERKFCHADNFARHHIFGLKGSVLNWLLVQAVFPLVLLQAVWHPC